MEIIMVTHEKIDSMADIAVFCKRKGFVYSNSEIYGGLAGFWDYGHLGVELKNNIKASWWNRFVRGRPDVVGIDGALINHPQVWVASGHVDSFTDPLLDCKKCGNRVRGDHLIEEALKIPADGMSLEKIGDLVKKNNLRCPKCKGPLTDPRKYNLMFRTHVGPLEDETSVAYLRPETAQLMFTNFRLVQEAARLKLPFGIAQAGKGYRNEISPRNFTFRSREFDMMEIEYFVHPDKINECPGIEQYLDLKISILTAEDQEKSEEAKEKDMTIRQALEKGIIKTRWHGYWLSEMYLWLLSLGIKSENLRIREHMKKELAHYAKACFDIEYHFPFGWKEIHGMADRTQFDISQHMKHSGKDLTYFDEETKQRVVPYVAAEPSQGLDRAFLAVITDAYEDAHARMEKTGKFALKLNKKIAPITIAVFPLMPRDGLGELALEVFNALKGDFCASYDVSGSIGRRYARMDEIGTPYCVTVDYDSLKKKDLTLRDRDTTKQVRLKIKDLVPTLRKLLSDGIPFEMAGKLLKSTETVEE